jgi:hypothetical protein
MTERNKKLLKKHEKTQIFVWEPFNLEPNFLTWTSSEEG